MDPQSQAFTPYSSSHETWKLQADLARLQQTQHEHAERLSRLERRQDEDARVKSVWGASSPFPSVLSGTPQQAPLQQPTTEHFRDFDEEANTLMSSLHLDAEDEPRRSLGAASRANSVRFDETANQNHFSHSSRPSVEFFSRSNSGLGGLQMNERSTSHKSEGRASSAHSIRSAASGRASSLNLESGFSTGDNSRSPVDAPTLAPGLLLLGTVPAIIRCWMNTNFKHDALLYAAVCTGSYKSYLDMRLIQKLGFDGDIEVDADGCQIIELAVYFPEAVPVNASSRSSSPAPQLPTLTMEFQVIAGSVEEDGKSIQVFLGSDVLRAHSADILFSTNIVTLFDDSRNKLSIPLVRPENRAAFDGLRITTEEQLNTTLHKGDILVKDTPYVNGLGQESSGASISSAAASPPPGKYRPPAIAASETALKNAVTEAGPDASSNIRQAAPSRPAVGMLSVSTTPHEISSDRLSQETPSRSGSTSATWGSWRREGTSSTSASSQSATLDWANAGKNRETQYQRRETGIKVLKPKSASRAVSTSAASTNASAAPSGAEGRSRFFDEGRRRSDQLSVGADRKDSSATVGLQPSPGPSIASITTGSSTSTTAATPTPAPAPKPRQNPIGGGSAFSWLNSSGN